MKSMDDLYSGARKAFSTGKLKKARSLINKVLSTFDDPDNRETRIGASLLLADIDMTEGQYENALDSCKTLLDQKPPDIFLSDIYRKIGTIFRKKGETEQAENYFLRSRDVSRTDEQRIRSFISLSGLYRVQSRYSQAIIHGKEAFDLALSLKDEKRGELLAESLVNLGSVKYNQGEYEAALPFYYQAQDIYVQQNNFEGISRAKIMVANVLSRQGKYKEALNLYKSAKEMQEELSQKSGVAICLTAMGNIFLKTGDIKRAIDNYNHAMIIETELENKWGLAILWKNLAVVYWLQGNVKQARDNLSMSIQAFESLLIKTTDYIEGLRLKIQIDLETGFYDQANESLTKLKALADERRPSNRVLDAIHAYERSGLLESKGEYESSIILLLNAYKMAYHLDLLDIKISSLLKLSQITIKLYERQTTGLEYQPDVKKAIIYLNDIEKVLQEHSQTGDVSDKQEQDLLDRVTYYLEIIDDLARNYDLPSLRIDAMISRAMLFRTMNDYEQARKLFKKAKKLSKKNDFVKKASEIESLSQESKLQERATKKRRSLELKLAKDYLDDVLRQVSLIRLFDK